MKTDGCSQDSLRLALIEIAKLGKNDADCNHSSEYLTARSIACKAIGIPESFFTKET